MRGLRGPEFLFLSNLNWGEQTANILEENMEEVIPKRKVRILSAAPAVVEGQLNELGGEYAPVVWNIAPTDAGIMVTVVLLHESEVRKAQLATTGMPMGAIRRN